MKKLIFLLVAILVGINYPTMANAEPKDKPNHYATKVHKKVKKQKVEKPAKVDIRTIKLNEMMAIYDENTSGGFFAIEKAREEYRQNIKMVKRKPEVKPVQYTESSKDLIEKASKYLGFGANELGLPRNLWCADFMNMLVGGRDRTAASYLRRGEKANYGCVNCVAVLTRRGGNHVGVVSGYDQDGDPIIISGNHNRVVGVGVYRREKVIGYRSI